MSQSTPRDTTPTNQTYEISGRHLNLRSNLILRWYVLPYKHRLPAVQMQLGSENMNTNQPAASASPYARSVADAPHRMRFIYAAEDHGRKPDLTEWHGAVCGAGQIIGDDEDRSTLQPASRRYRCVE